MIAFGTKAETLEKLEGKVDPAIVLPQIRFTLKEYTENSDKYIQEAISKGWDKIPLVIRSSAQAEDSSKESLAGHFTSVLNILGVDKIKEGVQEVIDSLRAEEDQIFIQPMVLDVKLSGVIFSQDPNTCSPYFVVNYDDHSGSTSSITSGHTNESKVYIHYKNGPKRPATHLESVFDLVSRLEKLLQCNQLDVEFAVDQNNKLYLLQVRPLILSRRPTIDSKRHQKTLENIAQKIKKHNNPHPYLRGQKTVFGVMPDWNPAEIIGVRPRPLSLSIYRELVTDAIWAYQRDNYGYSNMRSFPLMVDFNGLPYIDTRISFNSFIPRDLEHNLADRLVNSYIDRLIENPRFHDKVEFKIAFTCYTFDLKERLKTLEEQGFSATDQQKILHSLKNLTNTIMSTKDGYWRKDLERVEKLKERHHTILTSDLDYVGKIYWLLEDCKRYGTLPFAGLARAGFIAVQLLQSLCDIGILTREDYENFLRSLNTVSSKMCRAKEQMSRETFLAEFGHLRPGTYDILSPRYDEEPDLYFDWHHSTGNSHEDGKQQFRLSLDQLRQIETLLQKHGFDHDVIELFEFIQHGIEGREYSKFVFSRNLSDAISLYKQFGKELGIDKEELSYSDINVIKDLYVGSYSPQEHILSSITSGKKKYELACQTILPPLITSEDDVWGFYQPVFEPNFVTQNMVKAPIANINDADLKNKIIMIPSADPGFDWVFSRGIVGFITKYGGINSHMAIRAGELGISAVIGAGETLYEQWAQAKMLEIDAANRQVKIIA